MRRFIDLHTHSSASDGVLPAEELIRAANAADLAAVAMTDHDTVDALAVARAEAAKWPELTFIAGIEISAEFSGGTLHILGLGVDENAPAIRGMADLLAEARRQRNPKILARLGELGMPLEMSDVQQVATGSATGTKSIISRVHIAEAMRRKGYVRDTQEAFDKYIGSGCAAYVDKERLTPRQSIDVIRRSGGVAAMAHPIQLHYANLAHLETITRSLIADGLEAIECYHSDHSVQQTRAYLELARRLGLLVTGGSDYHGPVKPEVNLGHPRVPAALLEPLLAAIESRRA